MVEKRGGKPDSRFDSVMQSSPKKMSTTVASRLRSLGASCQKHFLGGLRARRCMHGVCVRACVCLRARVYAWGLRARMCISASARVYA